jgi:SARP family transcriptional regulator, regulator of embCAB operon
MRYDLLGPLRLTYNGVESTISARKIEVLLATLVIRMDRVVSMDQLIDEIWPDRPPRRALAALHVYVSTLRKLLAERGQQHPTIITSPPGYLFELGSGEADFRLFLGLLGQGRAALREDRNEDADELLERALSLWRGPVLGGNEYGPMMSEFVHSLTEQRTECLELYIESKHRLGEHRQTIGLLYSLIGENPFHETFHRQLMLALYHSERKADALNVYRAAYRMFLDQLGLPPCDALRNLHNAILADEDSGLLTARPAGVRHEYAGSMSRRVIMEAWLLCPSG